MICAIARCRDARVTRKSAMLCTAIARRTYERCYSVAAGRRGIMIARDTAQIFYADAARVIKESVSHDYRECMKRYIYRWRDVFMSSHAQIFASAMICCFFYKIYFTQR